MQIQSSFTDYYDSRLAKLKQTPLILVRKNLEYSLGKDRELPLAQNIFCNVRVSDFVVYFCGKYYPGKRITSPSLELNTCVYSFKELFKVLSFCDYFELEPFKDDFISGDWKGSNTCIKVVTSCTIEGYPLENQLEVIGPNLSLYEFDKIFSAREAAEILDTWMKEKRAQ